MDDSQFKKVAEHHFKQHDKDNSGYLETKELKAIINGIFETQGSHRTVTDQEIQIVLKQIDKNNDGKISREELAFMLKKFSIKK